MLSFCDNIRCLCGPCVVYCRWLNTVNGNGHWWAGPSLVVIIIRSSTDGHPIFVCSHPDPPGTSLSPRSFHHLCPSACLQMFLWLHPVTCVLLSTVPICLQEVICVCDSVPPASFSLRLSYCSALASLYTDPHCWWVRSCRCLALHAEFWCNVHPGTSAEKITKKSEERPTDKLFFCFPFTLSVPLTSWLVIPPRPPRMLCCSQLAYVYMKIHRWARVLFLKTLYGCVMRVHVVSVFLHFCHFWDWKQPVLEYPYSEITDIAG